MISMEKQNVEKKTKRSQYWWMPAAIIPVLILISWRGADALSKIYSDEYLNLLITSLWLLSPALAFLTIMLYDQRYVIHLAILGITSHSVFVIIYSTITKFGFVALLGESIADFITFLYGAGFVLVGFGLLTGAARSILDASSYKIINI